ncbi:MAG: hypothetical protein HC910_03315 [Spirulinaceae cyanobacterium SM2_1_0]|nr:hypothetical protein [Spirulinaceae cyanobacterium SM2_1_0]
MHGEPLTWQQRLTRLAYAVSVAIAVSLYNQNAELQRVQVPTAPLTAAQCRLSQMAVNLLKMRETCQQQPTSSAQAVQSLKARRNLL